MPKNPLDLQKLENENIHYSEYILITIIILLLYITGFTTIQFLSQKLILTDFLSPKKGLTIQQLQTILIFIFSIIAISIGHILPKVQRSVRRILQWGSCGSVTYAVYTLYLNIYATYKDSLSLPITTFVLSGVGISMLWRTRKVLLSSFKIVKSRAKHQRCPKCGFHDIQNKTYCNNCGYRLTKSCSCGYKLIQLTDRFCGQCGKKQQKKSSLFTR